MKKMDSYWAPRKKTNWGKVKKFGYLGYKERKCSKSKIGYFKWFFQKILLLIGCIDIQEFTSILKNTIPYNLLCKVNSHPINRTCVHVYAMTFRLFTYVINNSSPNDIMWMIVIPPISIGWLMIVLSPSASLFCCVGTQNYSPSSSLKFLKSCSIVGLSSMSSWRTPPPCPQCPQPNYMIGLVVP